MKGRQGTCREQAGNFVGNESIKPRLGFQFALPTTWKLCFLSTFRVCNSNWKLLVSIPESYFFSWRWFSGSDSHGVFTYWRWQPSPLSLHSGLGNTSIAQKTLILHVHEFDISSLFSLQLSIVFSTSQRSSILCIWIETPMIHIKLIHGAYFHCSCRLCSRWWARGFPFCA